jgi:hypothetical protein
MLTFKSFKTFKALLLDIEKNYGEIETGEAKFAQEVLRDYEFTKNFQYAILPNPKGQRDYTSILIVMDAKDGSGDKAMYSFDACAPIDMAKAKLIMSWVNKNIEKGSELHFFTTNSWNDIEGGYGDGGKDDAFAKFNTHDKIWIRKHWIDDY